MYGPVENDISGHSYSIFHENVTYPIGKESGLDAAEHRVQDDTQR